MAGNTLTTATLMHCPHGGTVHVISSSNTISDTEGSAVATVADTYIISSCPYMMPVPIPSPCITVRWITSDSVVQIKGSPTLSETSVGLCLSAAQVPQGTVLITHTQSIHGTE